MTINALDTDAGLDDRNGLPITGTPPKLLPKGVPVHIMEPFVGVGYGMNVGIVLDPSRASFNGGPVGAGTFFWGGVHGTWFWVDPVHDIVVVGMVQQVDAGNPVTGRPYPVADIRGIA